MLEERSAPGRKRSKWVKTTLMGLITRQFPMLTLHNDQSFGTSLCLIDLWHTNNKYSTVQAKRMSMGWDDVMTKPVSSMGISNLNPNAEWRCEKKGADIQCMPLPQLNDTHRTPAPGKGMREGGKVERKGRGWKKGRKGASIEMTHHEILAERVAQPPDLDCAIRASYVSRGG